MRYDAVVVGARCAGATLAALLARAGWRVLLVDRDRFPSDTVSTHICFPDSLQRLDELGVLDRLRETHVLPRLRFAWRVHGHEVAGAFTPVGGHDRATCVRRVVLDAALVDAAAEAGAETRLGVAVTGLLGAGTEDDPVRGVVLDGGEQVGARWVFGADGRTSTVARRLGLEETQPQRGELSFLFAYWRGLPETDWVRIDFHASGSLMSSPCEDDLHLLVLAGDPTLTRGTPRQRQARYLDGLGRFPAVLNPRLLGHAERVSDLVVVPETMMRGYYRRARGPGWALLGDAGHFKHPVTAQGIGDAVEQAWQVASLVTGGDPALATYQRWRDDRAAEHYEFSFQAAKPPSESAGGVVFPGLAADPVAGQEWLDVFTKRRRPSEVHTPERLTRWRAAAAYEDGHRRAVALLHEVGVRQRTAPVPACPDWTVRDLVAHLAGVAADTVAGRYFPGAADAWRDPDLAAARDEWTAGHVDVGGRRPVEELLHNWEPPARRLVGDLRRGTGFAAGASPASLAGPVADLGVHLHDLRAALGLPGDRDAPVTRFAFAVYRNWLADRITASGLPPLRLRDGEREWVLGGQQPAAALQSDRFELFRALSGRRSLAQICDLDWDGSPEPYLAVISPYPPPSRPLTEPPPATCDRAEGAW